MRTILIAMVWLYAGTYLLAQGKRSVSYTSYSTVLKTPTGEIHGTLTIPDTSNKVPVVLMLSGSGDTDRNNNSKKSRIRTDAFKMLADALGKSGIAALRFDKRGVGESAGAVQSKLTFDDYIADAVAWLAFLKQGNLYSRIIILGHSEGSLIGMAAAATAGADAFISLEGSSLPAADLMREQFAGMAPELKEEFNLIIDSLAAGRNVSQVDSLLMGFLHPDVQPYLISWMKYDPNREMSKLNMPVLVIHGREDKYINPRHAISLAKANPNAKPVVIEGMNYVLKDTGGDPRRDQRTYIRPDIPLHHELPGVIIDFIVNLKN